MPGHLAWATWKQGFHHYAANSGYWETERPTCTVGNDYLFRDTKAEGLVRAFDVMRMLIHVCTTKETWNWWQWPKNMKLPFNHLTQVPLVAMIHTPSVLLQPGLLVMDPSTSYCLTTFDLCLIVWLLFRIIALALFWISLPPQLLSCQTSHPPLLLRCLLCPLSGATMGMVAEEVCWHLRANPTQAVDSFPNGIWNPRRQLKKGVLELCLEKDNCTKHNKSAR